MARVARSKILYDGCYAHVFSRSIEKRKIFQTEEDFKIFLKLILKFKEEKGFDIHHYCLMHTHFHLAVAIRNLNQFSRGLQGIKWEYTRWFNKKYRRYGPLWRERFKSLLIENEQYLYACGLYIENNPVKAKMVEKMEDWDYSSSRFYLKGEADGLIDQYTLPELPKDVEISENELFLKGSGIGSDVFKFLLRKKILSP